MKTTRLNLETLDDRITPDGRTLATITYPMLPPGSCMVGLYGEGPKALDPITGTPVAGDKDVSVKAGDDNGAPPYNGLAITVAGYAAFVVNLNSVELE